MKIAIIGDLHLGARNGSNHFSDYFNSFFSDTLYPYMKKNKIKEILQLGDLFDSRTTLSYKAYHRCKDVWFGQLKKYGFKMHVLIGNHDIHYRNTLTINSPELLLSDFKNVNVISTPTVLDFDGYKIDVIPWVCDSNREEIKQFISRQDKSAMLAGHLELSGFPMYRGAESRGGESASMFDSYSQVVSGHYHTRSSKGNILYTGIPYEITWSDYADQKGFYVLDTETNKLEFVPNTVTMFRKIQYNNGSDVDLKDLSGKIIKVIVQSKKDAVAFERFIDSIKLVNPYDLSIVESHSMSESEVDDSLDIEDTQGIIKSYIDGITTDLNKDDLKSYMMNLYNEAIAMGD